MRPDDEFFDALGVYLGATRTDDGYVLATLHYKRDAALVPDRVAREAVPVVPAAPVALEGRRMASTHRLVMTMPIARATSPVVAAKDGEPCPGTPNCGALVCRHGCYMSRPCAAARLPARDMFAGMNGTERARAIQLEALKRDGQIREWRFEAVTLKLAPDCRYTPDFYVLENDGRVRFEETKGRWREDAKIKIRVAARLFPEFEFVALRVERGDWHREEFHAA